jgi:hypothetical protein
MFARRLAAQKYMYGNSKIPKGEIMAALRCPDEPESDGMLSPNCYGEDPLGSNLFCKYGNEPNWIFGGDGPG